MNATKFDPTISSSRNERMFCWYMFEIRNCNNVYLINWNSCSVCRNCVAWLNINGERGRERARMGRKGVGGRGANIEYAYTPFPRPMKYAGTKWAWKETHTIFRNEIRRHGMPYLAPSRHVYDRIYWMSSVRNWSHGPTTRNINKFRNIVFGRIYERLFELWWIYYFPE